MIDKITFYRPGIIIQNILGIDWKIQKLTIIDEILEKKGYIKSKEYERTDIKTFIMECLRKIKAGDESGEDDLKAIRSNLHSCDHFDLVRVDNIITQIQNRKETEYQWGSVVLNKKWKTL